MTVAVKLCADLRGREKEEGVASRSEGYEKVWGDIAETLRGGRKRKSIRSRSKKSDSHSAEKKDRHG